MSTQPSVADDESWIGSEAQTPACKPEEADHDAPCWTVLNTVQLIRPTVLWTTWPVPKTSGSMIVYQTAVTSDGTAKSIIRPDDMTPEQTSDFSHAVKLSEELRAAMSTAVEDKNKRIRGISAIQAAALLMSSDGDALASSDNTSLYDKALRDLIASNPEHTKSRHHWLDPITLSQTFPEVFKDFHPDYSGLPRRDDGDHEGEVQPAQQSSDADSHRDQTPRSTLRDELKIFDTPRRGGQFS